MLSNYAASKDGEIINAKREKNLKPRLSNRGYQQIVICDKALKNQKNYLCHRFVWESIKGVIPKELVIDHRDHL